MLTLTQNASTAVGSIIAERTDAEEAGLRIFTAESGAGLDLALVEGPQPGDAVVEEGAARVFLDEGASSALDDKVLDAQMQPNGGLQLVVAQRDAEA